MTAFEERRDAGSVRTARGTRVTPGEAGSDTYQAEGTRREAMQEELMQLGAWLAEHPRAARKHLEPIRSAKALEPGVYYNRGTGMMERIFSTQSVPLGHQIFRVAGDPGAPLAEIRRRVLEGK
jgi:hypothetical protein